MSVATPAVASAVSTSRPLRLLLFGLPGSGKSALLGAMTHASITQPDLLGGQFTELGNDLKLLRKQTYEDTLRPTQDEASATRSATSRRRNRAPSRPS